MLNFSMYYTCYRLVIIKNKVLKKKIVQEIGLPKITNRKITCILSFVMHITHLISWVK